MDRPTSIDGNAGARDEARCVTCQKHYQPAKFFGIAPAPKRNFGQEQFVDFRIFRQCSVHLSVERPGQNAIHGDVEWRPLERQGARQRSTAPLLVL